MRFTSSDGRTVVDAIAITRGDGTIREEFRVKRDSIYQGSYTTQAGLEQAVDVSDLHEEIREAA